MGREKRSSGRKPQRRKRWDKEPTLKRENEEKREIE